MKTIRTADVIEGLERILTTTAERLDEVIEVQHFSPQSLQLIESVTTRYGRLQADRLDRQHRIEELKSESNQKDSEIIQLKAVCNEREALIMTLDGHVKNFQAMVAELRGQIAEKEGKLATSETELQALRAKIAGLPADAADWAQAVKDKDVHIGNIERIVAGLQLQLTASRESLANYEAGHDSLEHSKFYSKLLAEKEAEIQRLRQDCLQRESLIQQLALDAAGPAGRVNKLQLATRKHVELKYWVPFTDWLFKKVVEQYWMKIGELQHYAPRALRWDQLPKSKLPENLLPTIGIVTPSYGQANFVESTMLSVLNQKYPKLRYVVQDGGSKDGTPEIIARYASQLHHWESKPDRGQADAIVKGFAHLKGELGPDDLMAWLNSDDLIAPRALRYVAEYFVQNPSVDVVYGHRIIVDTHDQEVGRWIMPRHDPKTLEWIDYVPQETLFWRKRIWDRAGGIDPSFHFALDWDLIARFQQAQAKIVRLPYCLGCFRVHPQQKTSQHIHTVGNEEMLKIRRRFHGDRHSDFTMINRFARKARFGGALTARLIAMGVRY